MAWTDSKMFRPLFNDMLIRTTNFAVDFDADTFKAAIYNNTITPDNDVTAANSAYNVGQWATTNEVTDTNWPAGGRALVPTTHFTDTADTVYFDSTDTTGAGNVTLANVFGCLVYDDTVTTPVADQGICYNYFGGTNSVTNGTFTIVWHANGVWRISL